MKQKNVFKFMLFTLCMLSLTFTACNDDDNIQIEQLNDSWYVVNDDPNLVIDGLVNIRSPLLTDITVHVKSILMMHFQVCLPPQTTLTY